jgi:CRISPR system Cascade subunit CasA
MNPSFDLVESPWISCIRADGTAINLGLRDTLARAHELRELGGESPLVTAALHRLLLAVLHRVFGPASCDEWDALWNAGRWDIERVDGYLDRWRHRFDLFHSERPFYQTPDERVKPKSVSSLVHEIASGNNPTLFDHHTDAEGVTLSPAQAARMLVTAQVFGLSGLCAPGLPNFTYGACVKGIIFLVQGESLFKTLALNLTLYPDPDGSQMPYNPDDCPAWEMEDPFASDRCFPRGYLDYLTWQNRRILLMPEVVSGRLVVRQMTMAPGLALSADVQDPLKHYVRDEKRGPLALRFRENRALWRDSAALFELRDAGYQPPRAFDWLSELIDRGYLYKQQTRYYLALGIAIGRRAADVGFFGSERLPLPLGYLKDDDLLSALRTALDMAEQVAEKLMSAAYYLAIFTLSPKTECGQADDISKLPKSVKKAAAMLRDQWGIERGYWSQLEIHFHKTMVDLPDGIEKALDRWRGTLLTAVWGSLSRAIDSLGSNPRSLKAMVCAQEKLRYGLAEVFPKEVEQSAV